MAGTVFIVAMLAASNSIVSSTAHSEGSSTLRHELPLKQFRDLVAVPIRIGDSQPLNFVLDSGSEHTTLNDARLVQELNLHTRQAGLGSGMGGSQLSVLMAPDVAIRSGGRELFRTDLAIHHLSSLMADDTGQDLQGLLGTDLFEHYVVDINPGVGTVLLHEPDGWSYRGPGHVIPLIINHRRAFIRAKVTMENGKTAKVLLMIDTGSESQLALILGSRRNILVPENHTTVTALGVGGAVEALVGPVSGFETGSLSQGPTLATFFPPNSMPAARAVGKCSGLVGNGLLGQYRTILDYRRKQLILEDL